MPDSSAGVSIRDITKSYGDVAAVAGVSLDVEPGSFVSLLGPSGCGKTTLLRLIGGFESPDSGSILIDGEDVTLQSPQSRPTAMVFQSYALFPTMTVGQNVGYGLSVKGMKRTVVKERISRALARVDLRGLEDRPVSALSGGQQQRVALARAIAVEPAVLLFDEPLSNLDLALREATRAELKSLQHELGTTSLYVTHDQTEALALSDKIAVMNAGRLVEEGTPESLYITPETEFVARFLGGANVLASSQVAAQLSGETPSEGKALVVRPDQLKPSTDGVAAFVEHIQFLGTHSEWTVQVGDETLRMWMPPEETPPENLTITPMSYRWVRLGE